MRTYDVIVAVDGEPVRSDDGLIREIAERKPGSVARLEYFRDGRAHQVSVKLAERPNRLGDRAPSAPAERSLQSTGPGELGLSLIQIDENNSHRFDVPSGMTGLLVQRVEPLSAASDAGIEHGQVILEINRQAVNSVAGFRRAIGATAAGGALAVYLYDPDLEQRAIKIEIGERRVGKECRL